MRASVVRMGGAQYYVGDGIVRNQFLVRIINKRNASSTYRLDLIGDVPQGISIMGNAQTLQLAPMGEEQKTIVLSMPETSYTGPKKMQIKVTDVERGDTVTTRVMEFLGPDPRTKSNAPLDPKNFVQ